MSLGMLSRWVTHMLPSDRAALDKIYGLDQGVLKGFIRHLTYVRNLCAHHSRVWNRRLNNLLLRHQIDPNAMGFPDGWRALPVWRDMS